jgi:hypothetical protein
MQLDDLKHAWAAHGALLEKSLSINEQLLREALMRKTRIALAPYALWRTLEVATGVAIVSVAAPVVIRHLAEPRYAVVGVATSAFIALMTAVSAYLLTKCLTLNYGGPVTAIQREVEGIKRTEYRALKWAVLGGVIAWLPAALILFEGLVGIDALARVNGAWLVGNLVFGVVVLGLGQVLSRRYVEQPDLGPIARRLADALSGRALRSVSANLAELARFEREEMAEPRVWNGPRFGA